MFLPRPTPCVRPATRRPLERRAEPWGGVRAQPDHNSKVGLIGFCCGGRHAFIYACQRKNIDACVEQRVAAW